MQQRRVDLLIPVVKAWSTDAGVEIASTGVQIHGGMGFIEETGAAQHLRDARIAPIYEGTNGIQANALIGSKLLHDRGAAAYALIDDMCRLDAILAPIPDDIAVIRQALAIGIDTFQTATDRMLEAGARDLPATLAGAVPYLKLAGAVAGGWLMARAALAAHDRLASGDGDAEFCKTKILTARFYAEHCLATAPSLLPAALGGATVMRFDLDRF